MWKCTLLGHRVRFHTDGATMSWACERCGGQSGSKTYESPAVATHYARAFDHRDSEDIGRRAPFIGMFPLRLWRVFRNRKH
ncbi:MAG TPA: hypothetical protein VFL99_13515 [Segeticoccus sp.]|uniref:hypothetical protein n=1 Tax=Segeticoccus sp. TaxID=2706531 RepID=UPI002D802458|nr:hypothetical protein [Segeticoccus sp.]HET8601341.1 hypothetical protein [Segeticoccus sp.]